MLGFTDIETILYWHKKRRKHEHEPFHFPHQVDFHFIFKNLVIILRSVTQIKCLAMTLRNQNCVCEKNKNKTDRDSR
jgi:hypothetical protein